MPTTDQIAEKLKLLSRQYFLLYSLLVGLLVGLTSFDLQIIQPSIDSSYTFLHNMLLVDNVFGSNVALTYGPLGFLVHVLDYTYLKVLALIIHGILGVLTGYILYKLLRKTEPYFLEYATVLLGVVIVSIQLYEWKLFALYLLGLLLTYRLKPEQSKHLYLMAVISVLFIYIKLSLGIASICVFIALLMIKRPRSNVTINLFITGVASIVVIGVLCFRSFVLPYNYLYNGIFLSTGYSEAMSIGPAVWLSIVMCLLIGLSLTLLATLIVLPKGYKGLIFILMIGTFFVWKAAITRQDIYGHVEALPYFGLFLGLMMLIIILKETNNRLIIKNIIAGFLILIGCGTMFFGAHLNGLSIKRVEQTFISPLTFWKIELCQLAPCKSREGLKMDKTALNQIDSGTVDVYPWESLFALENNLRWQPRPSPATYASYSPI